MARFREVLRPAAALARRVRPVATRSSAWVRREHPEVARRTIRGADRIRAMRARVRPRTPDRPLERVVHAFARAVPDAVFVQVGAHDGTQLDPLREAILGTSWRGVLVEPVPYVFERLEMRYGANPRLSLENVAIAEEDASRAFHHLPPTDGMWKWYDALGSFRRDVVEKHERFVPGIAERLVTVDLPCITFDTLCRRNGIDDLDLVQIDTEGFDLAVLELIDFARLRPQIVLYEHLHLTESERIRARQLMESFGYRQTSDGMDTICVDDAALSIEVVAREFDAAVEALRGFEQ